MYKYTLDPTPKKFTCPSCGKKRFVRYIDTETGEYLPTEYGRCDRESSCAYHNKPSITPSFKAGTGQACHSERSEESPTKNPKPETCNPKPSFIPWDLFTQSMKHYNKNNFVTILLELFSKKTVKKLIMDFLFGTSSHWPGATIFWQINQNHKIRSGQVMLFNTKTRSRVKKPFPHITWAHSLLIKQGKLPKEFNLSQCLFGEHQLIEAPKEKQVAIVESAKTAIIMTGIFPNYIWMATGGSHNIKPEIFQPIKDRNIILYPDLGQYDKWNKKAKELRNHDFRITVSNLLETHASKSDHRSGLDIADYFINESVIPNEVRNLPINTPQPATRILQPKTTTPSEPLNISTSEPKKALSKDDLIFNQLITRNPAILQLVEEFQLVNPKTNQPYILSGRYFV